MTFMRRPPFLAICRPAAVAMPPRRLKKSRNALLNTATIPSSSSPAPSAEPSQPSRVRRSAVSSGSAIWLKVASMNVPWPGLPGGQALVLKLAVGLEHRVRVDRQRGDHVPDLGQLVAGLEVAQPQGVLHLLDELQVRRHAGGRVEPELDRRPWSALPVRRRFPSPPPPGEEAVSAAAGPLTPLSIVIRQDYRRRCPCQAFTANARSAAGRGAASPARRADRVIASIGAAGQMW